MISVTCAIIRNDEDEILVVQRGESTDHPYKWEFPGGKIIAGETESECIIREIEEELSMNIVIVGQLPAVEHDYGYKKIRLLPFICDTLDESPHLAEHVAYKWLHRAKLFTVNFSEADVFVAKSYIERTMQDATSDESKLAVKDQENIEDPDLHDMINKMISMKEVEWVAASAAENPAIFSKLVEYSFSEDRKLAFHSSWTLTKVCDKYPGLIIPHLGAIIESLDRLDNESTQRSFLRIISFTDIDNISKRHQGILADHCFNALRSGFSAIAIKAYSMEILYRLAVIYPELTNELAASISMLQTEKSAGILARSRAIMRKLSGLTSNH